MGSRGPIRRPSSIRGEKEARKRRKMPANEPQTGVTPVQPDWLPKDASESWNAVIADLTAAGVVLQKIDCHAIAMFVLTVAETKKAADAGDSKLAARLGRDALQWAAVIGATPASRARLNIKPPKPVQDDPWAALDKM